MRREIIKQMIEIAGPKRAGDLSYDIMGLTDYDGKFIWCVYGDTYTGLQKCSKELIINELNTERGMYRYASSGYSFMLQTWGEPKFYCYNGEGNGHGRLVEVTKKRAISLCNEQYKEALTYWMSKGNRFPEQLVVGELSINCQLDYLQEQLNYAKEHDDNSLSDILKHLENRPRVARSHRIQIDKDFTERSFIFTEIINDVVELRGGIIFHGYPEEGYKENYSTLLAPTFGWQIHT